MMCTVADDVSLDFKVAGQAESPPLFLSQFNSPALFPALIFQPEDVLVDCCGRCSKLDGGKGRISFVRIFAVGNGFLLFFAAAQLSSNDSLQGCYFRAQEIGFSDTIPFLSFSLWRERSEYNLFHIVFPVAQKVLNHLFSFCGYVSNIRNNLLIVHKFWSHNIH